MTVSPVVLGVGSPCMNPVVVKGAQALIFDDMQAFQTWHAAQSSSVTLQNLLRGTYRINDDQAVRDAAGIQPGEEAGIQTGQTVGLTNAGALSSQGNLSLTNEAAVIAAADSGSGTSGDPYVIEDRDFTATGINLNLAEDNATYYVLVRNCRFNAAFSRGIENNLATAVQVRNCEIAPTSAATQMFRSERGGFDVQNCSLPGANLADLFLVKSTARSDLALTIRNNVLNTDTNDWPSTPDLVQFENGYTATNTSILIENNDCDWTSATGQPLGWIKGGDANLTDITIANNKWRGGRNFIDQTAQGSAPLAAWTITITNNDVDKTVEAGIFLRHLTAGDPNEYLSEVAYNQVYHSTTGSGHRVIDLNPDTINTGIACKNISVHHNKVQKATGSGAGNEAIMSSRGKDIAFYNNWVTEATDEAFEHALVIARCHTYQNVGDNVTNTSQVVDYFEQFDEATWAVITDPTVFSDCYVWGNGGDCDDYGIVIRGICGVYGHDNIVDNSAALSSQPNLRIDDDAGSNPKNCYFVGAMALAAQRAGVPAIVNGAGDNTIKYIDNQTGFPQTVVTVTG